MTDIGSAFVSGAEFEAAILLIHLPDEEKAIC